MKLNNKGLPYFLLCSIALSNTVFAATPVTTYYGYDDGQPVPYHENVKPTHKYTNEYTNKYTHRYTHVKRNADDSFDLIGAAGVAQLYAGNGELGVTSSETDKLVQTNRGDWNTFAAQLGAGYVHYFRDAKRYNERTRWFSAIEPEVNVYYLGSSNVNGDVWRFDSSDFNQLTYNMPIKSTRLMFDTALTIVSRKWLSLYGIAGIGKAWNRFGYSDSDKGLSCPDQVLVLDSNSRSNLAWEAGAGLGFLLSKRVSVTVEYLYTDLGTGQTSATGTTGTITAPIITAASFDLAAQTALVGLHIAL